MENKKPELPPFISVFHHRHGISVQVLPGGTDVKEFWTDTDGADESEDEYFEQFPLPDKYVHACNAYDEFMAISKLILLNWDSGDLASAIRALAAVVAKAEALS